MRGFWLSFRTEDYADIYHVHFREVGDLVHAYAMKTSGGLPPAITSPKVTSRLWLQRS